MDNLPACPNPRRLILLVTATLILLPGCTVLDKIGPRPKKVPVVATAYSSGPQCNGAWPNRNAIGGPLKSGPVTSAAADWSRFPVGTKFRVVETGKVYVVDDYGSAMVGRNKVDLFHRSYYDVYHWGVRQVNLEIIKWGCLETSLAVLRPRARAPHVRQMVEALEEKIGNAG